MALKNFLTILFVIITTAIYAQKKTITSDTSTAKIKIIKGIVEKGAEAGCIILKTKDNKTYTLLNIQTQVKFGSCLKVKGYTKKDMITTCMQGIPFYVINYCPCSKKLKPKYQRELPKKVIDKTN